MRVGWLWLGGLAVTTAEAAPANVVEPALRTTQEAGAARTPSAALDPVIRQMIEAAILSEDEQAVVKVLAVARLVAPYAQAEIDALDAARKVRAAQTKSRLEAVQIAKLRASRFWQNWSGEGELGLSRATGSNSSLGILATVEAKRKGVVVTHRIAARAELQKTNGVTTAERLLAGWQPKFAFEERAYAYGLAQYEHDPLAGYDHRYTLGGGLGYVAASGDQFLLEIEGGPALRKVEPVTGFAEQRIVGRGSLNVKWQVTPSFSFTQKAAVFLEEGNNNATSLTALDTSIAGPLKARLSYDVRYEARPISTVRALNAQTRATFVYGF